jgi:hypothetical protein
VQEQSVVGQTPNLAAGLQAVAAPDAGRHRRPTAIIGTASADETGWRNRKFADSPLEEDGFEPSVPRSGSMPESAGGVRRRFGKGLLTGYHFRKQPPGDRSERETVMGMAKGEP